MGKKDKEIAILKQDIEERNKTIESLTERFNQQMEHINEQKQEQMKAMQKQFQELQDYRMLMIVNINVSGIEGKENIIQTLNDGKAVVENRLNDLGQKDRYNVLTIPHTMSVGVVR